MRTRQDHSRERLLRHTQTDAERHLWQRLRDRRLLGLKFRRQHRIGPFIVDFVCIDAGLIVELDGSQHLGQADYDAVRTAFLRSRGFRVLRFWNNDILLQSSAVLEAILAALPAPRPSPVPAGGERG